MKIINEFKEFAIKGNMIDIAIGVIIGASFNKIIDVLVKDVFLPPLAFLTGGANWDNKMFILREASMLNGSKIDQIAIGYGKLLGVSIDFIIISCTVFVIVKMMNQLKKRSNDVSDKTVSTPKDIELLHNIKELIQTQNEIIARQSDATKK